MKDKYDVSVHGHWDRTMAKARKFEFRNDYN